MLALDPNTNRLELLEYRFERSTDPRQRGGAFFIEFPQNGLVPFGPFAQVHDPIVAGTLTSSRATRAFALPASMRYDLFSKVN